MTKPLSLILLFSILFLSCERIDIPENYPTTFKKLSSGILSQMRSSYAIKNKYMTSSVNDFGFCGYNGDPINAGTPPIQDIITQSKAIEIVKTFVSNNKSETAVTNSNDLAFYKISTDTGFGGAIGWHFKTVNQKVDTIEVMYSMILFHLTNGVVTSCYGNWFPEINIPAKFNIGQSKAKESLNSKVVSHYTMGGTEDKVTISKTDLDKSTIGLKILPIENENKIELRVCWQINIPGPVYYKIYVDVITGAIVQQEPTIISQTITTANTVSAMKSTAPG